MPLPAMTTRPTALVLRAVQRLLGRRPVCHRRTVARGAPQESQLGSLGRVRYSVAADRARRIESQAVSGGLVRRADQSVKVPDGEWHALAEGADETECERPVAELARFPDLDFEQPRPAMPRCERCVAAVAEAAVRRGG
jgi:hypothetical protein